LESRRIHVASLSVSTYRSASWDNNIESVPSENGEKAYLRRKKASLKAARREARKPKAKREAAAAPE